MRDVGEKGGFRLVEYLEILIGLQDLLVGEKFVEPKLVVDLGHRQGHHDVGEKKRVVVEEEAHLLNVGKKDCAKEIAHVQDAATDGAVP